MRNTQIQQLIHENPHLNIPVHEYNINVTSNNGEILSSQDLFKEFKSYIPKNDAQAHLYIHIPLCDYVCNFCNYVKKKIKSEDELQNWMSLVTKESNIYLNSVSWMPDISISSFYIGGGTGALLLNSPEAFKKFIGHFRSNYNFDNIIESTIEGNPENFTSENIDLALQLGFNRFSVGIQSLDDKVNSFANRLHSQKESISAIELLKKTGKPFSVDMMFGLPMQNIDSVRRDIEILIQHGVPAITIYRLRNSDREKMGIGNSSAWNNDKIRTRLDSTNSFPSVVDTYDMRDVVVEMLLENDYEPSPCGWWNKKGLYPNGNIPQVSKDKWEKYNTMLALGPGGYGWLTENSKRYIQTHNKTKIHDYIKYMEADPTIPPLKFGREMTGNTAIGSKLSFAFKARQPIFLKTYEEDFEIDLLHDQPYADVIREMIERGFLCLDEKQGSLHVTLRGETLHEEIMKIYFHDRIGTSDLVACQKSFSE